MKKSSVSKGINLQIGCDFGVIVELIVDYAIGTSDILYQIMRCIAYHPPCGNGNVIDCNCLSCRWLAGAVHNLLCQDEANDFAAAANRDFTERRIDDAVEILFQIERIGS